MRVILIVGNHRRHDLLAQEVTKHVQPVGCVRVVREEILPTAPEYLSEDLALLWERHFQGRSAAEARWFGDPKPGHLGKIYCTGPETLNSPQIAAFVERLDPEAVVVAGTAILRPPVLDVLPEWCVNFHMGLPPYRGTITPFWAMYMHQPDWIGVTYHTIQQDVDAGQVIHQYTPKLQRGWGLHDVASAAYLGGAQEVGLVLEFIEEQIKAGNVPTPDPKLISTGKLYYKRDWRPEMLRVIYEMYGDRMVDLFLDGKLSPHPSPRLVRL